MSPIRWFSETTIADVPIVGGKNASLGEMYRELTAQGVRGLDDEIGLAQGVIELRLDIIGRGHQVGGLRLGAGIP